MKRKMRSILSFLLSVMMILSGAMPAFAKEASEDKTDQDMPVLVSALSDTIVIKAEKGYEYAIQVEKDGENVWQWAQKEQYNSDEGIVSFDSLLPETEYTFACRLKNELKNEQEDNTEDEQPIDEKFIKKFMTTAPETTAPETTPPETTPPETTPPETTPPETTPPETTPPETTPPETTAPETTAPETKTSVAAPSAPVAVSVSDTKIVIGVSDADAKKGYTYEFSTNGKDFSSDTEYDGLKADTEYTFYVRVAAGTYDGKEYEASPASKPLAVRTLKSSKPAPKVPAVAEKTDRSIQFSDADASIEYGLVLEDKTVAWQPDCVFKNLKADTQYRFVFRAVYDKNTQMPSKNSEIVKIRTLKAAAAAPKAPVLEKRTQTSITVVAEAHQEYALLAQGKAGAWQTNGEFANLTPGTEYAIVTRAVYDHEAAMESLMSEPVKIKTIVDFSDSALTGVTNGATYDAGSSLTVLAVGSGMDQLTPTAGDSRFKPLYWQWGSGTKGTWSQAPYSTAFRVEEAGKYTLTVTFGLEVYTERGWETANEEKSLTLSFNVTAKTFAMKATSTKGGTISPSGTMAITQGKDYTFTMTPDKNHKIYKVYIDGKETVVKGSTYTFKNVNGDHTIHVVFEKSGTLDAPKTGDEFQPWILWTVVGVCAVVIILIAVILIYRGVKKKDNDKENE